MAKDTQTPEVVKAREYKKLNKDEEYDHEAAEELADALVERTQLARRASLLTDLINENEDLHKFIWTTAEGKSIPLHKLEDDHLTNILQHLFRNGRKISKPLRAEARKRNIEIPETGYDAAMRLLGPTVDVHNEDIGDVFNPDNDDFMQD